MSQTIGGDIGVRWGLLAAIETLFLIPVIVVTFALQNQLLRGVTFGTDQEIAGCRRSSSGASPSSFGAFTAVKNVSLSVSAGEVVCLLGALRMRQDDDLAHHRRA